jgi:hypothetical protein
VRSAFGRRNEGAPRSSLCPARPRPRTLRSASSSRRGAWREHRQPRQRRRRDRQRGVVRPLLRQLVDLPARVLVAVQGRRRRGPRHGREQARLARDQADLRRALDARMGIGELGPDGPADQPAELCQLHDAARHTLRRPRRRLRDLERGGRVDLLAPDARCRAVHRTAQGRLSGRQGRRPERHGPRRWAHGQQLRVRRGSLRQRRKGILRRRRRPYRHGLPGPRPRVVLSRGRRAHCTLCLPRLSLGARRHGRARRWRQVDLDDRAGVVHHHRHVRARCVGGAEAGRRDRGQPGALPAAGLPLHGLRSVRQGRRLVHRPR